MKGFWWGVPFTIVCKWDLAIDANALERKKQCLIESVLGLMTTVVQRTHELTLNEAIPQSSSFQSVPCEVAMRYSRQHRQRVELYRMRSQWVHVFFFFFFFHWGPLFVSINYILFNKSDKLLCYKTIPWGFDSHTRNSSPKMCES